MLDLPSVVISAAGKFKGRIGNIKKEYQINKAKINKFK